MKLLFAKYYGHRNASEHPRQMDRAQIEFVVAARFWLATTVLLFSLGLTSGCNRSNPIWLPHPSGFGGLQTTSQPGQEVNAQLAELERRARLLDENNRQLTTQLAQSQQQMQLYRERSELNAKATR